MEFLIIIMLVMFFANLLNVVQDSSNDKKATEAPIKEKFCPPHKWRHEELKDKDGNNCGWRLVCDICGPLKQQNLPDRTL